MFISIGKSVFYKKKQVAPYHFLCSFLALWGGGLCSEHIFVSKHTPINTNTNNMCTLLHFYYSTLILWTSCCQGCTYLCIPILRPGGGGAAWETLLHTPIYTLHDTLASPVLVTLRLQACDPRGSPTPHCILSYKYSIYVLNAFKITIFIARFVR